MRVPAFNRSDEADRANSRALTDPIAAQSAAACGCRVRSIPFHVFHALASRRLNFIDLFKSNPSHVSHRIFFAPCLAIKPLVASTYIETHHPIG
jgi:hypothetical protein